MEGKAIWILSFFSFLAAANAINAIIMWTSLGAEGTFQPFLFAGLTAGIPVWLYLLISVIATLLLLGALAHTVIHELSNKALLNAINAKVDTIESEQKLQQQVLESMQARVFLVDESLNGMRKEVSKAFVRQGEEIKQVQADLVKKFDGELADVRSVMTRQFIGQGEEIKKGNTNLTKNLAGVKDELTAQLARIGEAMDRHEQRNVKTEKAILKQKDELAEVKSKVERLENEFTKPKPLLAGYCNVEDVRGIGENTGKDLRAMGITNVSELLLTEPAVIAVRTGMSEKTVEKFQGRAQLALVPGVKEKDLVLLEEAGVMNRKELGSQDPFELGKKINGVFKVYVNEGKMTEAEKPTIEEIDSWVRFAKT